MNFIIENIFLIGLIIISGSALFIPYIQQYGKKLTLLQAVQLINTRKVLILDIREKNKFIITHLRGARNIPIKNLSQYLPELQKFKTKYILLICQNGTESIKAQKKLQKAGFKFVNSVNGGIQAWQAQGLPTVTIQNKYKNI